MQIEEYDYAFEVICYEEVKSRLENLEYDYGKIDEKVKKDIYDEAMDIICNKDDVLIDYAEITDLIDEVVDDYLPDYRK